MKLKFGLVSILGLLLVGVLFFSWGLQEVPLEQFEGRWYQELGDHLQPEGRFSIQDLILEKKSPELIDLELSLPHYHLFPAKEIRALMQAGKNCLGGMQAASKALEKAWIWQRATCKQQKLPADFFLRQPYIHPSGASYVALSRSFDESIQLPAQSQQALMTLVETLKEGNNYQKYLGENLNSLEAVLNDDAVIEAGAWVFVKTSQSDDRKNYSAFSMLSWNQFFKSQPYTFQFQETDFCLKKLAKGCWVKNPEVDQRRTQITKWGVFALILVIWLVILWALWRQSILKKSEEEKRKFTLQMLTHEIRTPVSSVLLSIENLRAQFDTLPLESQKDLLKLMDEVQRLKRTVESSSAYLKTEESQLATAKIDKQKFSVSAFIEKLKASYAFEVNTSHADFEWEGDLEALEFCLSNLLRNADKHGKAPIVLGLIHEEKNIVFEVKDNGSLQESSLEELAQPFRKSQRSQGLGLGLALVSEVCKKNEWKLALQNQPTRFSIHIPYRPLKGES